MDDSLQDKKSQTQDVHVHVGSCNDNTLTLCNGGWSTTKPGTDLVWRANPFTREEGSGVMPIHDLF